MTVHEHNMLCSISDRVDRLLAELEKQRGNAVTLIPAGSIPAGPSPNHYWTGERGSLRCGRCHHDSFKSDAHGNYVCNQCAFSANPQFARQGPAICTFNATAQCNKSTANEA